MGFSLNGASRRTRGFFQPNKRGTRFRLTKYLRLWVYPRAEGVPSYSDNTPVQTLKLRLALYLMIAMKGNTRYVFRFRVNPISHVAVNY